MINKDVRKNLACKKGNRILIWRWNDSTTTLALVSYTSSYVTHTTLDNTINALFAKLNDKFDKQHE